MNQYDADPLLLQQIAERCRDQVVRYAGHSGFHFSDFITRVPDYRRLERKEQFRVLVLLAKLREISSMIGPKGGWYFYSRSLAPPGAFNYERDRPKSEGQKIIDASEKQ